MDQEQVLQLVRTRGPLIPSEISKELGTNILLASAILSEFASRNLVKISNIKIGGSPLYYVNGQEDKLQTFLSRLPEKERRSCELLHEKEILRDSLLDPVTRVALRQCKDFAKPLEVTANGQKEIFWKWYLVPTESAETTIKKEIEKLKIPEPRKQELQKIEQNKPNAEVETAITQAAIIKEKPKILAEQKIVKQYVEPLQQQIEKELPKVQKQKGSFSDELKEMFIQRKISVIEEQIVKKDSEMIFVVKVPSAVGEIAYLCIAKNKAKCSETDLSYAYVQGQIKKLPVLFVSKGALTKKAQELIGSKEFSNMAHIKV